MLASAVSMSAGHCTELDDRFHETGRHGTANFALRPLNAASSERLPMARWLLWMIGRARAVNGRLHRRLRLG